jgi:endonuclease-3
VSQELKRKTLEVHQKLCAAYGAPFPFFRDVGPLTELVGSLLSHRTKNADSGRALSSLKERFRRCREVMDAPTGEVQAAISAATWPEQKAPRIQGALRYIQEMRGELSLDFLTDMPPAEAQRWLEAIPGVGPKTSAAVLLFSRLRMPALPVDSHHHRVAQRLGLIPANVGPGPAHVRLRALLPEDWDVQTLYDHHEALMYHGQKCCFYRNPACARCPVLNLCPFGQARRSNGMLIE